MEGNRYRFQKQDRVKNVDSERIELVKSCLDALCTIIKDVYSLISAISSLNSETRAPRGLG